MKEPAYSGSRSGPSGASTNMRALYVFALVSTAVCAETCGSTNDEGISGDDIGSAAATSTAACCTACSSFMNSTTNAVCAAAVWAQGQKVCYFKGAGYRTGAASAGSWVVIPGGTPTPPGPTPPSPTPHGTQRSALVIVIKVI